MADKEMKIAGNVDGKFYVDSNCIGCGLCRELSSDNFSVADDGNSSIVIKQPSSKNEEEKLEEVIENCPVGAIGDDGE